MRQLEQQNVVTAHRQVTGLKSAADLGACVEDSHWQGR